MPKQFDSAAALPGAQKPRWITGAALALAVLAGLCVVSLKDYPLFHFLSETSSIVVAAAVFLLVWNGRQFLQSTALLFLGVALLFVGVIDLFHALAYKGMGLFPSRNEANLATQLWIAARWLQSASTLAFAYLIGTRRAFGATSVLWAYTGITALLLWSIFAAKVFPDCYLESSGLTPFKIWSEYLISLMLLAAIVLLHRRKHHLDAGVGRLLTYSFLAAIASELAFTYYVSVYGLSNLTGHLLKIASFFLIYLALIHANLKRPIETLFRELSQAKTAAENSRAWLERVSEFTPDIIFVLDILSSRNIYSNQSVSKVLGYSPTEFRGLANVLESAIDPRDFTNAVRFYRDMVGAKPREVRQLTHRALHKDGSSRWMEIEVTPFTWDDDGRVREIIGIARDISGRKQAEQRLLDENREIQLANRMLRVFIEASGDDLFDRALHIVLEGMASRHGVFGYIDEAGTLVCPSLSKMFRLCEVDGKCIHYPPNEWKGLWARALLEKRSFLSNEPVPVPRGHVPIHNNLATPVLFQDKVIGLLNLANKEAGYTAADMAVLEGIAERVAPVLYVWIQREMRETERKAAQATLRESERRFRLLSGTSARLLAAEEPQGVINELCREVMVYLDCQVFFNFLADASSGSLRLNACAGIPERELKRVEYLDYGVAVCGCVAQEKQRIVANDILNSADARVQLVRGFGVRAYCCHPLMAQGQLLGTLSFGTKTRDSFTGDEVELMHIIADQVSVAIQRLQDRNALRASETALRSANERLELKVQERTAKLTIANQQLDARAKQLRALAGELATAEQRERKRLARVLHDGLQQQLAAAKLQAGMITAPWNENPERSVKQVEQLLGEAIKMSRSLSAELSPPVLQQGGLAVGLEWLCGLMQERHTFKIDVAIAVKPALPDDTQILLFESVRELLFNSIKHSGSPGAQVALRQHGEYLQVSVTDQGCGFDPDEMKAAGDAGGGFGLFSIRERLELIGGRLDITSSIGHGTRCTLLFPHAPAVEGPKAAPSPGARIHLGRIRVLLVDDHKLFRDGLLRVCRKSDDIDVVGEAGNGRDAVALARELGPDVILMDINMPGMDGVEATRAIHGSMPEARIIGLSMHDDAQIAQSMLDAGAVDYLNKGSAAADLIAAIRRSAHWLQTPSPA